MPREVRLRTLTRNTKTSIVPEDIFPRVQGTAVLEVTAAGIYYQHDRWKFVELRAATC